MRQTIIAIIALLAATISVNAQTEKNYIFRVSPGEVTYTEPQDKKVTVGNVLGSIVKAAAGTDTQQHPEFADNVRNAIAGAIGSARRLRVVDGMLTVDDLAEDEAAMYYDGSIGSISCTSQNTTTKDDKGVSHTKIEYRGTVTATINLKSIRSGEIIKTLNVNSGAYDYTWIETPEKAIANAIARMQTNITNELNSAYPLYASIVEGNTAKKDKQKEVYIDLGMLDGAFKGMTFNVYSVFTVAGKEAKKEIGRLRITEVMGDDISLCKVTKGGADIKKNIDEGKTLLIKSTN
ncbi:MAG: hypothetical protein MJY90_01310 [Bacteroidaceae bacterium]|nr:hypothetical protein [Bacteroidaceae bacterium]